MCKLRLAPLAVFGLCAAIVFAQDNPPNPEGGAPSDAKPESPRVETNPRAKPTETGEAETSAPTSPVPVKRRLRPTATPAPPLSTPLPKKHGFWKWLFGKNKATPVPARPALKPGSKGKPATPPPVGARTKATTAPRPAATPKSTATPKPAEAKKPAPEKAEGTKPGDTSQPPVAKATPVAKKTTKAGKAATMAKADTGKPKSEPPDGKDPEALEKWKYDEAKSKAMDDARLQELKGKADLASTEEEARKALRSYNKALFERMREIDPSIKDHIDRMEAAVLRRLGGE